MDSPGNGKTYLAEALAKIDQPEIFIPYAIEFQGSIIQLYDQLYHQSLESPREEVISALNIEPTHDGRW